MKRPPKKLPWLAALVIAIIGLLVRGEAPKEAAIPATSAAKIAEGMGKAVYDDEFTPPSGAFPALKGEWRSATRKDLKDGGLDNCVRGESE